MAQKKQTYVWRKLESLYAVHEYVKTVYAHELILYGFRNSVNLSAWHRKSKFTESLRGLYTVHEYVKTYAHELILYGFRNNALNSKSPPSFSAWQDRDIPVKKRAQLPTRRNSAGKTKSPRFVSEAHKEPSAIDVPRYTTVPSPALRHVNVAGPGKQSVWGSSIEASSCLRLREPKPVSGQPPI